MAAGSSTPLTMLAAALATFLLVLRHHLSADAGGRARRRPGGRLVRGRRGLCLALLSRRRSRARRSASSAPAMSARRSPNSWRRSCCSPGAGRPWPNCGRRRWWSWPSCSGSPAATNPDQPARPARPRPCASEFAPLQEPPGLALLALLLLRLRRLRRARSVAAALSDRRLWLRPRHRRHRRRRLLHPGQHVPRLWRRAVGPGRRAHGDVLDARRLGRRHASSCRCRPPTSWCRASPGGSPFISPSARPCSSPWSSCSASS